MLSNNKRFNVDSNVGGDLYDSTHSVEHVGIFGQYLMHPAESKESQYNPMNLFDDSNRENAKWLKKTRAYLAKRAKF